VSKGITNLPPFPLSVPKKIIISARLIVCENKKLISSTSATVSKFLHLLLSPSPSATLRQKQLVRLQEIDPFAKTISKEEMKNFYSYEWTFLPSNVSLDT
jgi:hypothetical protein